MLYEAKTVIHETLNTITIVSKHIFTPNKVSKLTSNSSGRTQTVLILQYEASALPVPPAAEPSYLRVPLSDLSS